LKERKMVPKTAAKKPKVARKASPKKAVPLPAYGAKLLRQAIPLLELTPEETTLLWGIASRNETGARRKDKEPRGAAASPPPEVKATPAATANSAAGVQRENQLAKTQNAEDLKRLERLRRARSKAERESLHKKSGFTTFVTRAPGSFEGGKS
jgi:hypothetical protein